MRYARPYVAALVLGIACSGVYSGARYLRAWLVKPLVDDVLPYVSTGGMPGLRDVLATVPGLGSSEAAPRATPSPAEETARAEQELRTRVAERARESLALILLASVALVVVLPLAHFGQIYLVDWTLGRVLVDIQQELCRKLLALPLGFHTGVARGEMLSRTINDATRAHAALDLVFAEVVQNGLALALGVVLLCWISWELALTVAIAAPLIALVIALFGRRIRKASRRRQESLAEVTQRLVQVLNGIKVIKAFRAEDAEAGHFERENLRYFRRNMKVVKNRALARTFVEGLNNLIGVVVLLVGMLLVLNHWGLSLGTLLSFALAMQVTYRPMKDLTKAWTQLQDAMPAADRFFELLDVPSERADVPGATRFTGVREAIRFEGVSFSYGREPVLRDVSLEVKAGETVAIVGRTGSGKTTLMDLLLGFYQPERGAISVDGVDVQRLERRSFLDGVAVVTQDPFLFAGSIRDNIRYGARGATDAEVERAAAAAHVLEFVDELPDGFETDVGDAGVRLSGGQRQRVTIARAIVRDPAILVFDEATSSLDAKSERTVQEAIEQLQAGRTTFVIAHRLSTVRRADRIVLLERGAVAASGTHDELLGRSSLYRELVSLQGLGDAPDAATASA
ncbi:MAG TPA: ABC transporter ATP-binding protein [Myxococcota bacterium]|nr:ABC transporter ATP-binding protein [Myxococcota bacterium]